MAHYNHNSDNACAKRYSENGIHLQTDPYSLHFAISLSQAEEPEALLETLLAGLVNVYSLSSARKVDLTEEFSVLACEQVISVAASEIAPGDTELEWDRIPKPIASCKQLLNCLETGEVRIQSDSQDNTYCFPITHKGHCRSVLELRSADKLQLHFANIRAILEIYANLNQTLVKGQQDKLTGLLNRQTFDAKVSRMLDKQCLTQPIYLNEEGEDRRAGETEKFPWLAIIDIDHFKLVNDKYGHLYGDEVILTIGRLLRQCFRRSDLLFRFGGEEFVTLLEPVPAGNVEVALERFRRSVENHSFQQIGNVSVSIGYAKFVENSFPPMILDRADQALYFAKNNGRNQVANYEALVEQGKLAALEREEGSIDLF